MAETLTSKTTEFSAGVTGAIPLHSDSGTGYLYPLVQLIPTELGGLSTNSIIGAATNNATVVKATPGQLYGFDLFNLDQTPIYLKFYDVATTPTPGTTTIKLRFGVSAVASALGTHRPPSIWAHGVTFATGIAFAMVTGITDADNTAVAASEFLLNVYYK